MENGTKNIDDMFEAGKRLKECREWRGLSRDELIQRVEALPSNRDKVRSVKQLSYIENGTRSLSIEYATLFAQALNIRIEYLLLKDGFRTESERVSAHVGNRHTRVDLISELLKLHGYEIKEVTREMPVEVDETGEKNQRQTFAIVSPRGSIRYFSHPEILDLIGRIDDEVEMQCAFQFRKLRDGANNIYDWEA